MPPSMAGTKKLAATIRLAIADSSGNSSTMFRQAMAESLACTPVESPCVRPLVSRSSNSLAASEMASATSAGAMPSASAAATALPVPSRIV